MFQMHHCWNLKCLKVQFVDLHVKSEALGLITVRIAIWKCLRALLVLFPVENVSWLVGDADWFVETSSSICKVKCIWPPLQYF